MKKKDITTILLVALSFVVIFLSFKLVRPFIMSIVGAIFVALLIYPIYKWALKIFKNPTLTSLIVVVMFVLVIAVPLSFIVNMTVRETYDFYLEAKKVVIGETLFAECNDGFACNVANSVNGYLKNPQMKYYMQQAGDVMNTFLLDYGTNFITKIPSFIVDLFVFLFFLFYLLKDGERIVVQVKRVLPLDPRHQDTLMNKTRDSVYAILYGQFLTASVQGLCGALGFFVLGIQSPILWGIVMMFLAIIPVGTGLVWIPASLYLVISGLTSGNSVFLVKGIILFVYGLLIISTIDNIIRPKLIGMKMRTHPLLILVGLLGGVLTFGFMGIFIGPLVLTLLVAILEMYKEVRD
jgi:predicted PurR-regulated permease PerM